MTTDSLRILVLHSRYLSGSASGENRVVEDEIKLLRESGHHVSAYISSLPEQPSAWDSVRSGVGAVWSAQTVAAVRRLIRANNPDVLHVHNLFPTLSPAVLRVADEEGVPPVITLHNYRLLCLPATFLRDGQPCETCLGRVPWRGVLHRCYRGSAAASAALASSISIHRTLHTFDRIKVFLAVSELVRAKHVQAGFPPERFLVRRNFAWAAPRRDGPGEYFLYLGRLSEEKGLPFLLEAWRGVPAPLVIVGDGDLRESLERAAPDHVRFVGMVPPERTVEFVAKARALVLPTTCYEGAPRSIPEAYAAGVPVIASDIGSIPECVWHEMTGLLVPPRDAEGLAKAATRLLDDETSVELGEGALRAWQDLFSPALALRTLEGAYRLALNRA